MLLSEEPKLLAPDFFLAVRWSARIIDFVEKWERRQSQAHLKGPSEFWSEAADDALDGVRQGHHLTQELVATTYRLSGVLPAPGDILLVGPLEIRVDQRHFTTRQAGGVDQAEVIIYLGVERYRYETQEVPGAQRSLTASTSSLFINEPS